MNLTPSTQANSKLDSSISQRSSPLVRLRTADMRSVGSMLVSSSQKVTSNQSPTHTNLSTFSMTTPETSSTGHRCNQTLPILCSSHRKTPILLAIARRFRSTALILKRQFPRSRILSSDCSRTTLISDLLSRESVI